MKVQPSLLRRLIRRSWQIVLLWLVVSAFSLCVMLMFIPPTYEAFSLLRVEPSTLNLFAPSNNQDNTTTHLPYLQTQVQLIKSDRVLGMAVASTGVVNLPSIRQSDDPMDYVRKELTVENVPDAYLIRVALESKIPSEAATIVNAVVDAYKHHTETYAQSANRRLRESLETEQQRLQKKIEATQNELKVLVQNGRIAVPAAGEVLNKNDHPAQPAFKNLGDQHFQSLIAEMMRTELELIAAESQLEVMEQALQTSKVAPGTSSSHVDELRLKVASLRKTKQRQTEFFEQIKVPNTVANTDTFQSTVLNHTLSNLQDRLDRVTDHLEQLAFENKQESFRVVVVHPAAVPRTPARNSRLIKTMAAAPAIVFVVIFGLFFLLEMKAGRLARGPGSSSARMRAEARDLLEGEYFPFKR
jgi:uncharacterized protein involved in exopolysaccharide biosynthesis